MDCKSLQYIGNPDSTSLEMTRRFYNQRKNTEYTIYVSKNEEFSVWKAYVPVYGKEEPMDIDENLFICEESGKLDAFKGKLALPEFRNLQHVGKSETTSFEEARFYNQISNTWQAVCVQKREDFSVWKAYEPVLDKDEPMEIDENPLSSVENWTLGAFKTKQAMPECKNLQYVGHPETTMFKESRFYNQRSNSILAVSLAQTEQFSVWKAYTPDLDKDEPMEIDEDETELPVQKVESTGWTVNELKSEEFSVWKVYIPVLDEEEPMEIDEVETELSPYNGRNTESINRSNLSWGSSTFELEKGETIFSEEVEIIWGKPIRPYLKEDSNLESRNLMDIDKKEVDYSFNQKSNDKAKFPLICEENFQSYNKEYEQHQDSLRDYDKEHERPEESFQDCDVEYEYFSEHFQDHDTEYEYSYEDQALSDAEFELWYAEHLRQETRNRRMEQLKNLTSKSDAKT